MRKIMRVWSHEMGEWGKGGEKDDRKVRVETD